jgi:hypothetical protein
MEMRFFLKSWLLILDSLLLICERRAYGSANKLKECLETIAEIQKTIFAFREYILNGNEVFS